ncbi:MAG: C-GCAxxG-C-C family protein [Candidatus Thorarchaeota archaeon]
MIDESVNLATKYFSGNYNCSQSVMKAILVSKDLDFEQITNLSAGLGAGMAHEGNVCGAVSGAIAALGVIIGSTINDVKEHKEATYAITEDFVARFKKKQGSILCDKLTGIEMRNEDERKAAMKDGTFTKLCPHFVADAVRIALELSND